MHPTFQPGHRFEWHYTVPERTTVPQLYHDTLFCRDMPDVLTTGYLVGMMPYVDWPRKRSLATTVSLHHLAPTARGMRLTIRRGAGSRGPARALPVEAWDALEKVCEGRHERCVIETECFADKLAR